MSSLGFFNQPVEKHQNYYFSSGYHHLLSTHYMESAMKELSSYYVIQPVQQSKRINFLIPNLQIMKPKLRVVVNYPGCITEK